MLRLILGFCICLLSFTSIASDQISSTEKVEEEKSDFSWELALDFALVKGGSILAGSKEQSLHDWLNIDLLLDVNYKRFFIQSSRTRFSYENRRASLGFHLFDKGEWQLDLINANYMAGFSDYNAGLVYRRSIKELRGIDEREFDTNFGFRFTRTRDDNQLSFDLVADLFGGTHGGWIIEGYYSKVIPYWNWDIYLGSGVNLYAESVVDYYYGVRSHETNENREEYNPGVGYKLVWEAVAQYPLSESWLLNMGVSFSHFSPSIAKSPLTRGQHLIQGLIIVRYVF